MPESLLDDKEVCEAMLTAQYRNPLGEIPAKMRTLEMCTLALRVDKNNIKYVPLKLLTWEFCQDPLVWNAALHCFSFIENQNLRTRLYALGGRPDEAPFRWYTYQELRDLEDLCRSDVLAACAANPTKKRAALFFELARRPDMREAAMTLALSNHALLPHADRYFAAEYRSRNPELSDTYGLL